MPTKLTGKCGSVQVRLIPAPRGAGIVAARTPKKVLQMAGIEDCYTCSRGSTKTLGNFVKVRARRAPPGGSGGSAWRGLALGVGGGAPAAVRADGGRPCARRPP